MLAAEESEAEAEGVGVEAGAVEGPPLLFPGGDVTAAGEEVREAGQALGIDKRAELGPVGQGIIIHAVEVGQALGGLGLGFAGTETARGVTVAIEQRRQIDNLPAAAAQGLHQLVAQEGVLVVA